MATEALHYTETLSHSLRRPATSQTLGSKATLRLAQQVYNLAEQVKYTDPVYVAGGGDEGGWLSQLAAFALQNNDQLVR